MKILIVGAGRIGISAAESPGFEANDITVVDTDEAHIQYLQAQFDLRAWSAPRRAPRCSAKRAPKTPTC